MEVTPKSPEAHVLLATAQLKRNQENAARQSLQRALELKPDYPSAQVALGHLEVKDRKFDRAMEIARALQEAHPGAAYGDELEGDVHLGREAYREASGSYASAYGKSPSAALASKLYRAHEANGEAEQARQALGKWLDKHPEDVHMRGRLAFSLQAGGERQQAIDEYRRLLESAPDNVTALNNIAWLYHESGSPEGLGYAGRAHELAPDKPEITDTYGWLLVQNGEINRGLVLLQEARVRAPHIPDIHYHMAFALYKAGRTDESRKELDRLLKTGKTFPELEDARALHEKLSGG